MGALAGHIQPGHPCPVCAAEATAAPPNRHGRVVAGCAACGHHFVLNPWSEAEVRSFYQGMEYFRKNCAHQGIASIEDDAAWQGWTAHRLGQLERLLLPRLGPGPLRILEVGCLEGRVLQGLARLGHNVSGCDVNAEVAALGARLFGLDIRPGSPEECGFAPANFDAVISFHTLEHLRDPFAALDCQRELLRPGGAVFLEVPLNEPDHDNRDHLHFFSEASLGHALRKLFTGVETEANVFADASGRAIGSALALAFKDAP
ncbi:class I SAM-dependent methyltransferase [Fundidesulfovibrio soli]|uniref:class I SAM-dependent methyltransferase n=1 Tax=Fundidesulfovibrio soli TaxID=2922716 RepID=UPI001FAECABF|nr:class I SAM-dependent methyltransferase [Fundidesulfovibrio soli]